MALLLVGDPLPTWPMTPRCRCPLLTKILGCRDYFQLPTKQRVCLDIPANLKLNMPERFPTVRPKPPLPGSV